MSYTVIQWTTGKVGVEAVKAILTHPELSLVGAYQETKIRHFHAVLDKFLNA